MFTAAGPLFDLLHSFRDFPREAATAYAIARRKHRTPVQSLLDVGCATGDHLAAFAKHGIPDLVGLDADAALVAQAKAKHKRLRFVVGDMIDVDLGRRFDAIVSFFGALAYVRTPAKLAAFAKNLERHLHPGGVLVLEPWHFKETYQAKPTARSVQTDKIAIARACVATKHGAEVHLDVQYLVTQGARIHHLKEIHKVGLFTRDQVVGAFTQIGLQAVWHDRGPSSLNGVIVAVKPRRGPSADTGAPSKKGSGRSPLAVLGEIVRRGRTRESPRP